jgi:tetratricopeptide (TPR) repeat protein
MTSKFLLWLKSRWLWLLPILFCLLTTAFWINESLFYEEDYLIGPVRIEHPTIKDLEIAIQHPASLSNENRGIKTKQLIITAQSNNTATGSVLIKLQAPLGVINILDNQGNRISGFINLPVGRSSVPTSIRLEHANTFLATSLQEALLRASVIFTQAPDEMGETISSLDIHIKLEPRARYFLRSMVLSGLGTVAPISLTVILAGFAARRFLIFKRIQPLVSKMQGYKAAKRWDKAVIKCKEIINIDPIYDNIQTECIKLLAEEELQNKRLFKLYNQALIAYQSSDWLEAKQLFEEVVSERLDYEEAIKLLAEVNGRLNETERLEEYYINGIRAELSNEIVTAINYFQKVADKNPNYKQVRARLNKLQHEVLTLASQPYSMRMLLTKPEVDFGFIAFSIDAGERDISESLLKLTYDSNKDVRLNLAIVASYMRSPAARRVLEHLLEDPDAEVQAIAASVLGPPNLSTLIKQLRDPDKWKQAGGELIKCGESAVQPLIATLGESYPVGERALEILRAMGKTAHPKLVKALNSVNPLIKERAMHILKENEGEEEPEGSG